MKESEIKKALYREKPLAEITKDLFLVTPLDSLSYKTTLENGYDVYFNVPLKEWKEGNMVDVMESQLLIRWLLKIKEQLDE